MVYSQLPKTMNLPHLQPVVNSEPYINGDVTIHPEAALASGVIIQASPNSKVIIEAEVCLGMGVIINAYEGLITIKKGTIVGAGVLIIGHCTIGGNSCIGTSSTLIDTSIESQAVIKPGSLLGDTSRQVDLSDITENQSKSPETNINEEIEEAEIVDNHLDEVELEEEFLETETLEEEIKPKSKPSQSEAEINSESKKNPVVGKMYVNQLLVTLFPQNQAFKKNKLDN